MVDPVAAQIIIFVAGKSSCIVSVLGVNHLRDSESFNDKPVLRLAETGWANLDFCGWASGTLGFCPNFWGMPSI